MSAVSADLERLMLENSKLVFDNTIRELRNCTLEIDYKRFFKNVKVPTFNTDLLGYFCVELSKSISDNYRDMGFDDFINIYKIPFVLPYRSNEKKIIRPTPSTGSKNKMVHNLFPTLPDPIKSEEILTQDLVERFNSLETKIIQVLKETEKDVLINRFMEMLFKMKSTPSDQSTEKSIEMSFMNTGLQPVRVLLNFVLEQRGGSLDITNDAVLKSYVAKNSVLKSFDGASASTDILITQKDEKGCIRKVPIEIKRPSISNLLKFIKGIPFKNQNLIKYETIFCQIICQMFSYTSPIAAVSDGQNTLILLYTGEDFEILNKKVNIPFKYFTIDECSMEPPSAKNLTSRIVFSIIVEFGFGTGAHGELLLEKLSKHASLFVDEDGKVMKAGPHIVLNSSSEQHSSVNPMPENSQECFAVSGTPIKQLLSEGDLKAVIKCDGDDLVDCWDLKNSDHVKFLQGRELVVKIYDISRCKHYYKLLVKGRSYTHNEFLEYWNQVYQECYLPEISALQKIQQYNDTCSAQEKINTPKMLLTGEIRSFGFNGWFLVFEYLPFIKNKPTTQSHVESGIQQLKLLHTLGIVHGDIASRNVCVDEKDNVYLIDFDCAREVGGEVAEEYKLGDIYDMEAVVEHSRL